MITDEKFNQVWDDVMTIATRGRNAISVQHQWHKCIESLESIIYVRTTYRSYDQWMEMEGCE